MQSRPAKYRNHMQSQLTLQRSIVLHRNNRITKDYRILMAATLFNK